VNPSEQLPLPFSDVAAARISYFKRFKMEADLDPLPPLALPEGYTWVAWSPDLIETHAQVLCQSFHEEIDGVVFPSLGCLEGCRYLMREISHKLGFEPLATWLVQGPDGPVGSIQGIRERTGMGAVQNLGVVPAHRGKGLGSMLLFKAMYGFRASGLGRVVLEVTAQNDAAVRLYRRLGFRRRKTIYKPVHTVSAFSIS
jgi:GNAT superfamily N-acetyltransferase